MWQRRETKVAKHFEFFTEDGGKFLGHVIKFTANGACYARGVSGVDLGRFASVGEAKDAVENYYKGGKS